jgi:hypothetical protein
MEFKIIHKYSNLGKLETKVFKEKYGPMIEGQNHNSKIGRYWQPIILTRWLIVNIIMVILKDSYVA